MSEHSPTFKRNALRFLLGTIAVTIGVAVFGMILGGDFRIIGSSVIVVGGCLVSLLVVWTMEQGRFRALLWGAQVTGMLVVAVGITFLWMEQSMSRSTSEVVARTCAGAGTVVMWIILSVTALSVRFRVWWWHTVPNLAIGMLTALAIVGVYASISPDSVEDVARYFGGDAFAQAIGVGVVLTVALMLALPLMRTLDRMPPQYREGSLGAEHIRVLIRCPRCAMTTEVRANQASECNGCGLKVKIELEEPRCACGYLLHHLKAPVCPECGRLVTLDMNWRTPGEGEGVDAASLEQAPRSP